MVSLVATVLGLENYTRHMQTRLLFVDRILDAQFSLVRILEVSLVLIADYMRRINEIQAYSSYDGAYSRSQALLRLL